jgi:hypothetical protein
MPGARLTVEQRRTIQRCYRIGLDQRQIAAIIGKDKSTVSRELARSFSAPGSRSPQARTARGGGAGYRRVYDAERAHRHAQLRARRPKVRRLDHGPLRDKVWAWLRLDWSPEQIAKSLPIEFPDDLLMRVNHETIYQSLFVQTKGELKRELTAHLRTGRIRRKAQTGAAKRITLGITEDIRLSARPAEAADRAVPGHYGRRPDPGRHGQGCGDHPGRTQLPVRPAGPAARAPHRGPDPDEPGPDDRHLAAASTQVDRLGPRLGNGPTCPVQDRDRDPDLLLRPPLTLATWLQRKHQRTATSVLAQRRRPTQPDPDRMRPRRPTPQHPPPQDPELAAKSSIKDSLQQPVELALPWPSDGAALFAKAFLSASLGPSAT